MSLSAFIIGAIVFVLTYILNTTILADQSLLLTFLVDGLMVLLVILAYMIYLLIVG